MITRTFKMHDVYVVRVENDLFISHAKRLDD